MDQNFGTHGTTKCRANKIAQQGFKLSQKGFRGSGVYFWGYKSKALESHCHELATGWWKFASKRGDYTKDSDTSCCVIYTALNTESFLDLDKQQVREKFIEYCEEIDNRDLQGDSKLETLTKAYDMFVDDLEKKLGKVFELIHVRVQKPNGCKTSLHQDLTGQPSCFVAKDLSCITITEIKEI